MAKTQRRKPAKRPRHRAREAGTRYAPAARLLAARDLLATAHGATLAEIGERLACGRHTAMRAVKALEAMGEAITEEREERHLRYRIAGGTKKDTPFSTMHVLALAVARQLVEFLEGTMLKDAFDEVVEQLARSLGPKSFTELASLSRKVLVVQDAPWEPVDRADVVDALVTALVKEERVTLRTPKAGGGERVFSFEPYTLVVMKKGLYAAGHSHHHQGVRLFGLDKVTDADWEKGARFEPPAAWDPRERYGSVFDLFDGPATRVVIAFTAKVARYVVRRTWHDTQRIEEHADGRVVLTMRVRGTTGITSWLLGFGDQAEVLEPASLRDELAGVTSRMAATYARPADPAPDADGRR
jgi:proteasome accessory factor B